MRRGSSAAKNAIAEKPGMRMKASDCVISLGVSGNVAFCNHLSLFTICFGPSRAKLRTRIRGYAMNFETFITCAVTGSGATADKHPALPITPAQIADAAIEAARARMGAAICCVRNRRIVPSVSHDVEENAGESDNIR